MRIAVLCSDLGIRVPGDKGASIHLTAISRAFAATGHDVMLVGVAGHGAPPAGMDTLLLPHPGRTSGLRRELRKLRFNRELPDRVIRELRAFGPDVLYERLSLFGEAGRRLARDLGVPHVIEINALLAREESDWRGLRMRHVARRREAAVLANAQLRIAVSAEVAAEVAEVAPGPPLRVVTNGLDADALRQLPDRTDARARLGLLPDAFVLGFVGALRPWHGVDQAIDALALMANDVTLVVAGDGPVRPALAERAVARGVADRVRFLGQMPHDQVPGVLSAIDVAVAPYPQLERFIFSPLKVFEYMGAGLPVVASDIGQLRSLVELGSGLLVTPSHPGELAAACTRVRECLPDYQARAQAARARILAEHGWDRRAHEIVDAIEEVATHAAAA